MGSTRKLGTWVGTRVESRYGSEGRTNIGTQGESPLEVNALFKGTFNTLTAGQESSPWCGKPKEKKAGKYLCLAGSRIEGLVLL